MAPIDEGCRTQKGFVILSVAKKPPAKPLREAQKKRFLDQCASFAVERFARRFFAFAQNDIYWLVVCSRRRLALLDTHHA